MGRVRAFRSKYEVMYAVPASLFENLKATLNQAQKDTLSQLNKNVIPGGIKGLKPDEKAVYLSNEPLPPHDETTMSDNNAVEQPSSPPAPVSEARVDDDSGEVIEEVNNDEANQETVVVQDESMEEGKSETPILRCSVCKGMFTSRSDLANHKIRFHKVPKRSSKSSKKKTAATSGTHAHMDPKAGLAVNTKKRKRSFLDSEHEDEINDEITHGRKKVKLSVQNKVGAKDTIKNMRFLKKKSAQSGKGIENPKRKKKTFERWF